MIGTVTLHYNANYGANLQAYALVKCLSSLTGEEVRLIDYRNERIRNLYRVAPFNLMDNGIRVNLSSCKRFVKILLNMQGTYIRDRKFYRFRKNYIPMTSMVKNPEEIAGLQCSHLFVGSDQIWNDWITGDQKNRVFYGNVKSPDTIVAAYAPSLSNSSFSGEEDRAVSEYINNFDFLSVREEQLIDLIHGRYQGEIETVCDPVFLLGQKEWEELDTSSKKKEPYVFVYLLERNPVLFELAKAVAEHYNLKLVVLSDGQKLTWNEGEYLKTADPSEFIGGIRNAEFVVTNSFHGTVYSMMFHKKFLTIPDTRRGIRMIALLEKYGLQERLVVDIRDFVMDTLEKEIDYSAVDKKIEAERSQAVEYLKKVLQFRSGTK